MNLFHIIEEGQVIIHTGGVYRQSKVYRRGADVYAQFGTGFIKLHGGAGTSKPKVSWQDIDAPGVSLNELKQPKWDLK